MSRRRRTLVWVCLQLVCLAASVGILRQLDRERPAATLEDVLYISSPKFLKRASLGFDGLLADIYWTRAVQYYGEKHHAGGGPYELLWPLLHITTELDPHLIPAYEFGGTFLSAKQPQGAGTPEKAIALVRFGIHNNPDNWRLYSDLGYIYYDLKQYRESSEAFFEASRIPNAHPFMKVLAAQMAQHGGEAETARVLWSSVYQTTRDKWIRGNAAAHLRALEADSDVDQLQLAVETYRRRTGRVPHSFYDLEAAGLLRGTPVDPRGDPYLLTSDGRVVLRNPDELPFVTKGLPPGYVAPAAPKNLGPE